MGEEIERKYLVVGSAWQALAKPVQLRQGYLSVDPERIVRVRVADDQAWVTIKGRSHGARRAEYEFPVPKKDATEMLDRLCLQPLLEKRRSRIPHAGLVWEVDEFLGENAGLIIAEVELTAENQPIALPEWIGIEVTGDPRYYNSNLLKNPYSRWRQTV
jgi:CYTH domain-containing protein